MPASLLRRVRPFVIAIAGALLLVSLASIPAQASPDPTGTVTGTVTDGTTHAPISGVPVRLLSMLTSVNLVGTSGPDGRFEIDSVPYGNYTLGFPPLTGYQAPYMQVDVVAINSTPDLDVAFTPYDTGSGVIQGTIVDSVTSAAIPNGSVMIFGTDVLYNGASGPGSSFSFTGLPAGSFNYSVSASGYVTASTQLDLNPGQTTNLVVQLVAANSDLTGQISDNSANPIPGLGVLLEFPDGSTAGFTQTGIDGSYDFPTIGAGSYTVAVGGVGTSWMAQSQTASAIANQSTSANFTLAPRVTGSISGQVTDGTDGIPGICEVVYDSSGTIVAGASGENDGTYEIDDLDPGTDTVAYWDCSPTRTTLFATEFYGGGSALSTADTFPVTAADDGFGIDAVLVPGASISGHIAVQTSDGTVPLPINRGMQATVLQDVGGTWEPYPNFSSFAGAGGVGDYTVSGLLPGTYRVGFLDSHVGPRAFSPSYWQGATTVASAAAITVASGDGKTGIDGLVSIPVPSGAATPVDDSGLAPGDEGDVASAGTVTTGDTTTVDVGTDYIGEWVSVWGHSTPLEFGTWEQVRTDGTVVVTVPTSLQAGAHKLVVQTADDQVVGWNPVTVAAGSGSSGSGSSGSGSTAGGSTSGSTSSGGSTPSAPHGVSGAGASTPVLVVAPAVTPTATPTATPAAEPSSTPDAAAPIAPRTATPADVTSPLGWILGGGGAIVLIALLVVLVRRARRP